MLKYWAFSSTTRKRASVAAATVGVAIGAGAAGGQTSHNCHSARMAATTA